jgi:hypothetical protein
VPGTCETTQFFGDGKASVSHYNTTSQIKRGFNEFGRKGKGKIEEQTTVVTKQNMCSTQESWHKPEHGWLKVLIQMLRS